MACLPSPSHRKSSSLAHTSPGAAPGACCGEEAPVRAQLLLSRLHQQPCSPGSTPTLLTAKLKPSSLIQRAFPVPHPYTHFMPSTQSIPITLILHVPPISQTPKLHSELHTPIPTRTPSVPTPQTHLDSLTLIPMVTASHHRDPCGHLFQGHLL